MTNRLAPQKNTEHHAADKDCHNEHGCQESSKIIGHVYIIPVYVGASTDFSRNPKDPGRAALCPSLFTVALKMKFSKGTVIELDAFYQTIAVQAAEIVEHDFPEGFSACWCEC
jgi:hypothetical protein